MPNLTVNKNWNKIKPFLFINKRICGKNLSTKKKAYIALTNIVGVGKKSSQIFLKKLSVFKNRNFLKISKRRFKRINRYLISHNFFEGRLRRKINNNLDRLLLIRSYRGSRYKNFLPSRGQRTRTNAKTTKRAKKRLQKLNKSSIKRKPWEKKTISKKVKQAKK